MQREISSSWQGDTALSGADKNDLIETLGNQLEIGWMEVVLTAWNLRKKIGVKMAGEPIHISDESFEKDVMQSSLPVIVDFWAPWCGPCKMIAPTLEKLAKEQEGKLVVAKINTDDHAEWMQKFGIQGIPTLLFVSGGKVVHRQVGALPERMLREVVTQFLDVISQN